MPYARLPELSNARLEAYRTGYSAWWCSTYLSSALVEQKRRAAGSNGSG